MSPGDLRRQLEAARGAVAVLQAAGVDQEHRLIGEARATRSALRPRYEEPSVRAMFDHRGKPITPKESEPCPVTQR